MQYLFCCFNSAKRYFLMSRILLTITGISCLKLLVTLVEALNATRRMSLAIVQKLTSNDKNMFY
jgi:hypothetical protein